MRNGVKVVFKLTINIDINLVQVQLNLVTIARIFSHFWTELHILPLIWR